MNSISMIDWQLGLQAFHEGRMREAADRLGSALEEHELTVSQAARYETYAYLGVALYALGLPAEAVTAFEMAFRFAPGPVPPADLTMNLAHAYLAAGRRDAAREAVQFLLAYAPGHVAATMLAARLEDTPVGSPISGMVLGSSSEAAERYIRTLSFSRPISGGYAPAEVQEALSQLQRLISDLTHDLKEAHQENAQREQELLHYRQMEDAVVENIIQTQASSLESSEDSSGLSPIEILFRQKS